MKKGFPFIMIAPQIVSTNNRGNKTIKATEAIIRSKNLFKKDAYIIHLKKFFDISMPADKYHRGEAVTPT